MGKEQVNADRFGAPAGPVKLDAATVNAHLAILRELNAPQSAIDIAERVAAAISLRQADG
jgi:hypothetical protein